jgi:hypothetical protein
MQPETNILLRIRNVAVRTAQAFIPALAVPDDAFAADWLPPAEYGLYLRMDRRDRAHACLVARTVLRLEPQAGSVTLRAALLHDVGKTVQPYNPLHRVLVHLHTPAGLPREPLQPGLRGAWQVRTHHEAIGAEMIRAAGGDDRVATLVGNLAAGAGAAGTAVKPAAMNCALQLLARADGET